MQYTQYGYMWPPRPEDAIPTSMLGFYEKQGWVGQIKKNGTCTVVFAEKDVTFKTRHNDDHKAWAPKADHIEFFKTVADGQWCVFEAELLHSKGGGIKDTFYIFDILVWQGENLVGTTFAERQALLFEIFPDRIDGGDHWKLTDRIWLAKPILKDFLQVWTDLSAHEDEGIVLKNPNAKLKLCNKQNANKGWQIKCRRPHKNYAF